MSFRSSAAIVAAVVVIGCSDSSKITDPIIPPPNNPADTSTPPPVVREMRGMWIATVANIDWPSRTTLTQDQQKAELIDIFDRAAAARINTIVLQVRPATDALYNSALEPWGIMLTGTSGKDPGYDPLAFAITEAHNRGMELHAWVNLFRVGNTSDSLKFASNHVFNTKRDLVRIFGGNLWLDPGEPASHEHSIAVIKDIVTRYDIDGIHTDDFYYPYPVTGVVFPDDATFARFGNGMTRDDWRRDNINRFIERMYREVHAIKPTAKVGIAPFGIWRPGNPAGITGLDSYASTYSDSRKWLQQGWLDYISPQLYWAITPPQQSYPALLDWWIAQNTMGRHIWPGLAVYRVQSGVAPFTLNEIPDQIKLTRTRAGSTGNLLYNTSWTLKQNSGAIAAALQNDLYKTPALVPPSPWLDATPPTPPTITQGQFFLTVTSTASEEVRWWVIRTHNSAGWETKIQFGTPAPLITINSNNDRVVVQAVDRAGNISAATEWRRPTT
ncbi:MAG TPA: family 10 glycosylhydrolase [Longimicrobiales bacterium]|nr:family 10 glycosylhydrolase [Longimicrobiales bacterium]